MGRVGPRNADQGTMPRNPLPSRTGAARIALGQTDRIVIDPRDDDAVQPGIARCRAAIVVRADLGVAHRAVPTGNIRRLEVIAKYHRRIGTEMNAVVEGLEITRAILPVSEQNQCTHRAGWRPVADVQ